MRRQELEYLVCWPTRELGAPGAKELWKAGPHPARFGTTNLGHAPSGQSVSGDSPPAQNPQTGESRTAAANPAVSACAAMRAGSGAAGRYSASSAVLSISSEPWRFSITQSRGAQSGQGAHRVVSRRRGRPRRGGPDPDLIDKYLASDLRHLGEEIRAYERHCTPFLDFRPTNHER